MLSGATNVLTFDDNSSASRWRDEEIVQSDISTSSCRKDQRWILMISRRSSRQTPRTLPSRWHAGYKKISLMLPTHSDSSVSLCPMDIAKHSLLQFVIEKHLRSQLHFVTLLCTDTGWWVFDDTGPDLVYLLFNTTSQVDYLISISAY